ncbi:MAG: 30S ribosomal protein S6 [Hyphomicrobiales bacterium]|nr:30S ribosomal protein S6 [Hyphomicrobiales bacterium]
MAYYEHIFMSRPDVTAQQVEGLIEQYKAVIEGGGGKIAKQEYWGVKSLAYKIRKNRKAHFTLLNLDAPHAAVAEMERQMRLSEDVIRFLTIRVEEHEEGPSIMMQKRDDRRDREDRFGDRGYGGGGGGFRDRGPRRERDADGAHAAPAAVEG